MKEKQIEEMAKIIRKGELDRNKGDLDCTEFPADTVIQIGLQRLAGAKALYNAGYRNVSDVAREIFEEIESCKWSETQYGAKMLCFEINSEKYAKLKNKYTESEKDNG